MNRTRRATRSAQPPLAPGSRASLRLDTWPGDPTVGHLIVLEHDVVPDRDELRAWVDRARRRGLRAIRTGALFPEAATSVLEFGFDPIDSLVLLRADLDDPRTGSAGSVSPATDVKPLGIRHLGAAAVVDRLAFGELWGNDRRSLADIRRATPAHRARRIPGPGPVDAFAISGAGDSDGYVQRLAVHPDRRRSGLAGRLLDDSLRWMRSRSLHTALVNTGVGNVAALALYEGRGFRRLDERLTVAELTLTRRTP